VLNLKAVVVREAVVLVGHPVGRDVERQPRWWCLLLVGTVAVTVTVTVTVAKDSRHRVHPAIQIAPWQPGNGRIHFDQVVLVGIDVVGVGCVAIQCLVEPLQGRCSVFVVVVVGVVVVVFAIIVIVVVIVIVLALQQILHAYVQHHAVFVRNRGQNMRFSKLYVRSRLVETPEIFVGVCVSAGARCCRCKRCRECAICSCPSAVIVAAIVAVTVAVDMIVLVLVHRSWHRNGIGNDPRIRVCVCVCVFVCVLVCIRWNRNGIDVGPQIRIPIGRCLGRFQGKVHARHHRCNHGKGQRHKDDITTPSRVDRAARNSIVVVVPSSSALVVRFWCPSFCFPRVAIPCLWF